MLGSGIKNPTFYSGVNYAILGVDVSLPDFYDFSPQNRLEVPLRVRKGQSQRLLTSTNSIKPDFLKNYKNISV